MNGVSKRKRPEIESSETESTATDGSKHLNHSNTTATSLSEPTTLVTGLKEIIEKQTSIIENAQADLIEVKTEQQNLKRQNSELQEAVRDFKAQLDNLTAANMGVNRGQPKRKRVGHQHPETTNPQDLK